MFKGFWIKRIVSFLSKMDGIEGFSFNDVISLVKTADTFTDMSGLDKANQVIKWSVEKWEINGGWIIQTITQLAYVYARIKGIIKR